MSEQSIEARLNFLEESNEILKMQNRVLALAIKGMIRAMPSDMTGNIIESIQIIFDDEVAQLQYENNAQEELFYDMTYEFFREKMWESVLSKNISGSLKSAKSGVFV